MKQAYYFKIAFWNATRAFKLAMLYPRICAILGIQILHPYTERIFVLTLNPFLNLGHIIIIYLFTSNLVREVIINFIVNTIM